MCLDELKKKKNEKKIGNVGGKNKKELFFPGSVSLSLPLMCCYSVFCFLHESSQLWFLLVLFICMTYGERVVVVAGGPAATRFFISERNGVIYIHTFIIRY